MSLRQASFVVACAWVHFALATVVYGQGPISSTETITTTVVPGQTVEQAFPNVFDPNHPKLLIFGGTATGGTATGAPNNLVVTFDWLGLDGLVKFSDPISIPMALQGSTGFDTTFTVPFCPERVSLHLTSTAGPIAVNGIFKHECLVPEPSSAVLGLLGLGMALLGQRRHRCRD